MSVATTGYAALSNTNLCGVAVTEWADPWFGAVPYVRAMSEMIAAGLDPITEPYYDDPPGSIVQYFLANATQWKGEVARGVKAELKKRLR